MKSTEIMNLPVTENEYRYGNEQTMRRSIEQNYSDLRNDVIDIRDHTDRDASLALHRHHFLLMGG